MAYISYAVIAHRTAKVFDEGEMEALLAEAWFADIAVEQRQAIKYFQSHEDYFLFLRAISSGQRSSAPELIRSEARRRIADALEKRRTPEGIEIRSSLLFATASRPRKTGGRLTAMSPGYRPLPDADEI